MAISSLLPTIPKRNHLPKEAYNPPTTNHHQHHPTKKKKKTKQPPPPPQQQRPPPVQLTSKSLSSWEQLKTLLSCRSLAPSQIHDPSTIPQPRKHYSSTANLKIASSCNDLCSIRDVIQENTIVVHRRPDHDYSAHLLPSTSRATHHHHASKTSSMHLRKLSGCYECRSIYEPTRHPVPRTISRCPECGEVFTKTESLEIHHTIRHAVSELGPEDSSRNIVEIIFTSSWIKKDAHHHHYRADVLQPPVHFKIERILKVHNTQRTVSRFEDCRDAVKSRAALLLHHGNNSGNKVSKRNPRCAADGNELLRFHCTTVACSLGARGSTSLCGAHGCRVCAILRHGFGRAAQEQGSRWIRTTAGSISAHECCSGGGDEDGGGRRRRAMLVCRVIAGRVRTRGAAVAKEEEEDGRQGYDSVSVTSGDRGLANGGTLEDLFVSNPRAILPCFVVVYRTVDCI